MKKLFILLVLVAVGVGSTMAQNKIGYANIDLILLYMPESKALEQQLSTYQKSLSEQLSVKEAFAQTLLNEYLELKEKGTLSPDDKNKREQELTKLDNELQDLTDKSENKLLVKRQELMEPIVTKLQTAIDAVAVEKGFTHVFNSVDGSGVSILLYGPESDDLTTAIMAKLGIKLD